MKVFDQANRKKVAMTEAFFKEIGQYLNINRTIPVSKLNITQKDHVYTEWVEDLNEGKATFFLGIFSEAEGNMQVTKKNFYDRVNCIIENIETDLMCKLGHKDFEMDDEFDDVEEFGNAVVTELRLTARYEAFRDIACEIIDETMSAFSTGDVPIQIYDRANNLLIHYPVNSAKDESLIKTEMKKLNRYKTVLGADSSLSPYSAMDIYRMIDTQEIAKAGYETKALYLFGKLQVLSTRLSEVKAGRLALCGADRFFQSSSNQSIGVLWNYSTDKFQEFNSIDDFPEWAKEQLEIV